MGDRNRLSSSEILELTSLGMDPYSPEGQAYFTKMYETLLTAMTDVKKDGSNSTTIGSNTVSRDAVYTNSNTVTDVWGN